MKTTTKNIMNNSAFANKVVWIVGASSGIGRALALQLAGHGALLALSARRTGQLEEVARLCEQRGAQTLIVPLDYEQAATLDAAVSAVLAAWGRVDQLFLCAGISQRSLTEETEMAVYRRLLEVNFFGAVALTKAVLPTMLAQGSGHITVLSSVAGKIGTPLRSGYAAAKHALYGFFDSLRAEVHQRGVQVTMVSPGYVSTDITLSSLTGDGSAYGKLDQCVVNGVPVDECARRVLMAVARKQPELIVAQLRERFAVMIAAYFPRLIYRLVRVASPT
jgi:dehydrogenase/reductase SDR family protein 7B